jgi:hypothetical protein
MRLGAVRLPSAAGAFLSWEGRSGKVHFVENFESIKHQGFPRQGRNGVDWIKASFSLIIGGGSSNFPNDQTRMVRWTSFLLHAGSPCFSLVDVKIYWVFS